MKQPTSSLTAADVRQLFRQRNNLLAKGAAGVDDPVIVGVDNFRKSYIQQEGLENYLRSVLGQYANVSCDIRLIHKNGDEETVRNATPLETLAGFSVNDLPYQIIVHPAHKKPVQLSL